MPLQYSSCSDSSGSQLHVMICLLHEFIFRYYQKSINPIVAPSIESSVPVFFGLFLAERWEILTTVLVVQCFCLLVALLMSMTDLPASEALFCFFFFCLAFLLPLIVVGRVCNSAVVNLFLKFDSREYKNTC